MARPPHDPLPCLTTQLSSPSCAPPLPPCFPSPARRSITFQLAQDPNSHNLGTTVWDASIVLAKWLEKAGGIASCSLLFQARSTLACATPGLRAALGQLRSRKTPPAPLLPTPLPALTSSPAPRQPLPPLQSSKKGDFSRQKARGKRCLELGSGMGLGGSILFCPHQPSSCSSQSRCTGCPKGPGRLCRPPIPPDLAAGEASATVEHASVCPSAAGGLAFALLGAEVTLTDLAPVLPLLERNYAANLSPAALRGGRAVG